MPKSPTISIVIPAYNESENLPRCLEAIRRQTVKPYEVIVVDNNSSDRTLDIARNYPFVTVLRQSRQGVLYARNTGFNAATGDIIGRIDADTVIASDWVETLTHIFKDKNIGAVSGSVEYYHAPYVWLFNGLDCFFRRYLAFTLGKEYALQGANLALRREVWQKSKKLTCAKGGLHEDFDLSIHIREAGFRTAFTPALHVAIAFRQASSNWRDFTRYALLNPGTYAQHNRRRCIFMYPVVWIAILAYPLLHILYLGFDDETGGFSFASLLDSSSIQRRVNPATFID